MVVVKVILWSYVLWFSFLAVMALRATWGRLPLTVKVIAAPGVVSMVVLDVLFNIAIASFLFIDPPHQWFFTQRISQYKLLPTWRTPIAKWICTNLLDPFQLGGHCR